jgi:hypothetical protein
MNKLKHNVNKDFTVAPNQIFRDNRLSFKAKGLWLQIVSLDEGWNFSMSGLAKLAKDNEAAIASAIRELAKFGYIKWQKVSGEHGRFTVVVTTLLPVSPPAILPHGEIPHAKLPHGEIHDNKIQKDKVLTNKVKNNKGVFVSEKEFRLITEKLGQSNKVKYLAGRKEKLAKRLETFKLEEILKAAKNLSGSPFHRGENENGIVYATFDFLMRSDEQVDKWLNNEDSTDDIEDTNWQDKIDLSKI